MAYSSQPIISGLQCVGLTAPAIYTGFTFAYSHVVIPPITTHAPPQVMARQWLQAYQIAPIYVAPLIILGASSNAALAYFVAGTSRSQTIYALAAVAIASIIPYTALYMEPGVNGAGKWKAQELLREDGFKLQGSGKTGTNKATARESAKQWAQKVDMQTIAETWARTNAWRYVITGLATVASAVATILAT